MQSRYTTLLCIPSQFYLCPCLVSLSPLYLAIINIVAINSHVQVLCECKFLFHLHKYLGVVLLGHQILIQRPKSRVSLNIKFLLSILTVIPKDLHNNLLKREIGTNIRDSLRDINKSRLEVKGQNGSRTMFHCAQNKRQC